MAKMFTKEHHKPIVMGFMRFYNYGIGDVGSVKLDDVFHFPIKGENKHFDVLLMNMAHNSMFPQTKKRNNEAGEQAHISCAPRH